MPRRHGNAPAVVRFRDDRHRTVTTPFHITGRYIIIMAYYVQQIQEKKKKTKIIIINRWRSDVGGGLSPWIRYARARSRSDGAACQPMHKIHARTDYVYVANIDCAGWTQAHGQQRRRLRMRHQPLNSILIILLSSELPSSPSEKRNQHAHTTYTHYSSYKRRRGGSLYLFF